MAQVITRKPSRHSLRDRRVRFAQATCPMCEGTGQRLVWDRNIGGTPAACSCKAGRRTVRGYRGFLLQLVVALILTVLIYGYVFWMR